MSYIDHYQLPHSTVLSIYVERETILLAPDYQRQGEIWPNEKKQLLVDSIINRYDIPKLYFHKLDRQSAVKKKKNFAVIDGRQRLEAIFGFLDGDFNLSPDFEYLEDEEVKAAGFSYADLAKKYPRLKQRFESFTLPITVVETDDIDLIDEMFSRLNEAVPLNAAEKRNALGGEMARAFTELSNDAFFKKKIRFSDHRYRHREVAARLMFVELSVRANRLTDTKKLFLDQITREYKNKKREVTLLKSQVTSVLEAMSKIFTSKDMLLSAQGAIPVFYLLIREAQIQKILGKITREAFASFNDKRQKNRAIAEGDITKADFDLLEYDRMSQQGTNDAYSIRERLRILAKNLGIKIKTDF